LPTHTGPAAGSGRKGGTRGGTLHLLVFCSNKNGQKQKWSKTKTDKNKNGQNMFGQKYVRSKIIMVKNNNGQKLKWTK
jgi:hypothetical protein